MNKLIAWFLSMTKLGKVVEPVQQFLSGKKTNLAGLAIAVPALVTMVGKFAEQGTAYLLGVAATPEFHQFMEGISLIFIRAAIAKAGDPAKDPNA